MKSKESVPLPLPFPEMNNDPGNFPFDEEIEAHLLLLIGLVYHLSYYTRQLSRSLHVGVLFNSVTPETAALWSSELSAMANHITSMFALLRMLTTTYRASSRISAKPDRQLDVVEALHLNSLPPPE